MKILVCISKVPDTTSKISFTDNNTKFSTDKVQFIMNPYDEWYALVRACELKEAQGGTVTVIHVGGADSEQIIRRALAIGADDAVRVDADPTDGFFVASQIAAYAKANAFDFILTGKETIDYNAGEVGGMLAGLLDWPYVSMATSLNVDGNNATLDREISGGKETVKVTTPFVASASKGMAEARIPNIRGITQARTKPLQVIPAANADKLTSIKHYELPPEKKGVKLIPVDQPEQLIDLLHNEAKVI
ncbi:MAG TPA: electron transfer flavoprotein subunit beta/FixA family protein [Chitinophagales bacterium]|nr:electron transfer flavoprotein subunit beta/FixA family protein [Chitinophagales bacterium]